MVVAAVFAGKAVVPAWRTLNSDFPNYYTVARLVSHAPHGPKPVYEWEWLQRRADAMGVGAVVSYVPNPPLCFVPVLPVAMFEPLTAKRIWTVLDLLLLAATIILLARITGVSALTSAVLALFCVIPLRANFLLGQMYVLLLFLVVAALWLEGRRRQVAAALVLAAGAAIKLYPLLFVFYFLKKKRWTAAAALVGGWVASLGIAALLLGPGTVQTFLLEVLPRTPRAEIIDPFDATGSSIATLLHRWFLFDASLNPHPLAASWGTYSLLQPLAIALIVAAAVMCTRRSDEDTQSDWAMWIVAMLAISSMPVSYHFCMMIAVAVIAYGRWQEERRWTALAIVALFVVVSMPLPKLGGSSALAAPLQMPRLMATLVMFAVFVYERRKAFEGGRALAAYAGLVALLATPGAVSNVRYYSRADVWETVPTVPAAMSVEPAAAAGHLYYTSMTSAGYAIRDTNGQMFSPAGHNAFHPSVDRNGSLWFEVFDGESRIAMKGAGSTAVDLTRGESPSVSPDGIWLAFVRGGKLWLRSSDGVDGEVAVDGNVLDASLSDSEVVFAVQNGLAVSLFRKKLGATDAPQEWMGGARHPAVSPDGKWLAFSRREGGAWHLWVRNVESGGEHELTSAQCNAVTPTWSDEALYYASDCGRGPGLTEIRRIPLESALRGLR